MAPLGARDPQSGADPQEGDLPEVGALHLELSPLSEKGVITTTITIMQDPSP